MICLQFFYTCCDFVFIIVNADVTFFLFFSKGLFKRFFCHKLLFFLLCLSKCFCLHFFSCCNFVFYSCKICVTFPLLLQKDFWLIFQPHFHRKLLAFAFLLVCGISLAVHVHCKKIPLVVLGNCRFILQIFL